MCKFCVQHGEGKKWYLTMRNYSEERLAQACGNPLDCRQCLDRCPEKLFGTYPAGAEAPA